MLIYSILNNNKKKYQRFFQSFIKNKIKKNKETSELIENLKKDIVNIINKSEETDIRTKSKKNKNS